MFSIFLQVGPGRRGGGGVVLEMGPFLSSVGLAPTQLGEGPGQLGGLLLSRMCGSCGSSSPGQRAVPSASGHLPLTPAWRDAAGGPTVTLSFHVGTQFFSVACIQGLLIRWNGPGGLWLRRGPASSCLQGKKE